MSNHSSISSFDTKEGLCFIKDPIHSYLTVTTYSDSLDVSGSKRFNSEIDLISNPWLQRLRRVRQTQAAYAVFPGLEHSRFQHVLGVMHLAGKMARKWYGQLIQKLHQLDRKEILRQMPETEFVEEVFRLAGLLHDVGHGPFSHSLDKAYKKVFDDVTINHEVISNLIIERELAPIIEGIRRSPHGQFKTPIDPKIITYLIHPRRGEYEEIKFFWLRLLRPIISGLIDADALDYLSRDAFHGGLLEYGLLDIDRFLENTFLVYSTEPGKTGLYLQKNSLLALEFLLLSRFQMYRSCYYHKSVRAFELKAEMLLEEVLRALKFPNAIKKSREFLERFYYFDEYWLFGQVETWERSRNKSFRRLGEQLRRFANRDHGLHLTHSEDFTLKDHLATELIKYKPDQYQKIIEEALKKVIEGNKVIIRQLRLTNSEVAYLKTLTIPKLKKLIFYDSPLLDIRRGVNPVSVTESIRIYDSQHAEETNEKGIRDMLDNLPMIFLPLRMYVGDMRLKNIIEKIFVFHESNNPKAKQDTSY